MSKSRFEITNISIVTSWRHNLPLNNDCTICRNNLNTDSQTFLVKGISSYVVIGECDHAFHRECLEPWIKNNPRCPICSTKWIYKQDYQTAACTKQDYQTAACTNELTDENAEIP